MPTEIFKKPNFWERLAGAEDVNLDWQAGLAEDAQREYFKELADKRTKEERVNRLIDYYVNTQNMPYDEAWAAAHEAEIELGSQIDAEGYITPEQRARTAIREGKLGEARLPIAHWMSKNDLPKTVSDFGSTVEEIFVCYEEVKNLVGSKEIKNIPLGARHLQLFAEDQDRAAADYGRRPLLQCLFDHAK